MATTREIQQRIHSIKGTQQITRAMKLVATAKLQKVRAAAEEAHNRIAGWFTILWRPISCGCRGPKADRSCRASNRPNRRRMRRTHICC